MDHTQFAVLPESPASPASGPHGSYLGDVGDVGEVAVRWLAERCVMSDAFARILLSQLARQDGVDEAAAARSLLANAAMEAQTSTSVA